MSSAREKKVLVACYDGTSRVPGAGSGGPRLWEALAGCRPGKVLGAKPQLVREESKSSAVWCKKLHALASATTFDMAIGGEHLVSFPLLEVLAHRHTGLRVVVLDAHHDAYDYPLLTHYSLFHFTQTELGVPGMVIGARHELDEATDGLEVLAASEVHASGVGAALQRVRAFVAGAPFYFSIDLDVLAPESFPAVSDPVGGGLSVAQVTELTREILALGPVGADVVEYNAMRDESGASLAAITPVLKELACWLG